ncbi:unnamed protein product [Didymodactylos carnosus]|uniref:Uncharacterized protein n=1 Tax=Didymodactylos carnosus TaxID=1234261 RepID=A0A814E7D7_9BILA|nr:unnamed protein product [Didymodactylos carnosus]CAF0722374.1 unnamed protein product [Didymodactylos carnosus]CAF0965280.1 unnamed protein product [Didymodactylos carnosus]CAF3494226.1 unnamed protein product [Didymodactylos carnosus]CAF3494240.1 unnamed protein product [Didymodactylos carnosus]
MLNKRTCNELIDDNDKQIKEPTIVGEIRVGRRLYEKGFWDPMVPGYKNIVVLMPGSPIQTDELNYGMLGPYSLKNDREQIMENVWQFSRIWKQVPKTTQYYPRKRHIITWNHSAEIHMNDNQELTNAYWNWREKGMNNKYFVRWPTGGKNMEEIQFAFRSEDVQPHTTIIPNDYRLSYIESRKKIYLPVYTSLVKKHPKFQELVNYHRSGENLLIIEVDGPHEESLPYYKNKYDVNDTFIENHTMLMTLENNKIMINDDKHPWGHGYALAMAVANVDENEQWI